MVSVVKVFKKSAPNGKTTVYLGRRDFIDNTIVTEPVDGVVMVDSDYLKGRRVFASVTVTFRFGREEDEVMGLSFSKSMQISCQQVYPNNDESEKTPVQERLLSKLGTDAIAFSVNLPDAAPASVQLQSCGETAIPLGVIYELKVYVADDADDIPHKRSSVTLAVRKVQYSPCVSTKRQPSTLVSKGFALSNGKLNLEVTLDREIYYHNENISASLNITNKSRKTVKSIKCSIVQHVELTMTNNHFTREVAGLESKEGCPITPGSTLSRAFSLTPAASCNKLKGGVALDGRLKDSDAHLASSTLVGQGKNPNDSLGIIVTYSLRVRLNCGTLGGELVADLPCKLMHPMPGSKIATSATDEQIDFEDFARLRRGMSVDQQ